MDWQIISNFKHPNLRGILFFFKNAIPSIDSYNVLGCNAKKEINLFYFYDFAAGVSITDK
jgi:hypothetical protein